LAKFAAGVPKTSLKGGRLPVPRELWFSPAGVETNGKTGEVVTEALGNGAGAVEVL
jgi:hypothetical protein